MHSDGVYGAGVWLQVGAKFGLVALVGLLRVSGNRGGKHVLGTVARKTMTKILVNHLYLSDLKCTFPPDKYGNILILLFEIYNKLTVNICQKENKIKVLERSIQTIE